LDATGFACSDGAASTKEIPKSITQVGFGAVTFEFVPTDADDFKLRGLACIGGQVPGRQTVPRAELWGAIQTLIRVSPQVDFDLGIDASYVTKGVLNRHALEMSLNGDLWNIFFEILDSRTGNTNIFKIKSHLDEEGPSVIMQKRIRFDHLIGNTLADEVAGAAVERCKPDLNKISKARRCERHGFLIAKRLALVQADAWEKRAAAGDIFEMQELPSHPVISLVEVTQSVKERLIDHGHRLSRTSKGFKCEGCKVTRSAKNFKYWESNRCRPRPPAHLIIENKKAKLSIIGNGNLVSTDASHSSSSSDPAVGSAVASQLPPSAPVTHGFDDEEGEFLEEDHEATAEPSDHDPELAPQHEEPATPAPSTGRLGKRLRCKTNRRDTAYADVIPLGSRLEAQTRKRKVRQANLAFSREDSAARKRASTIMASNASSITEWLDNKGQPLPTAYDDDFIEAIHSSHVIKAVNSKSDAIFCDRCGAYSDGGPLRLLRSTCTGVVAPCRRYWHTVLLSGKVPGPGVRIPSSCKRSL
jgi:hypothetical protein